MLSVPGSAPYRLRADESGYDNLSLAGDWIETGLNAGCIEGATLGGLQAANAVLGRPLHARTSGFRPRERRASCLSPRPVDHEVARAGLEAAAAVVERMLDLGRTGASGIQVPIAPNQGAPAVRRPKDDGRGPDPADLTGMSRRAARRCRAAGRAVRDVDPALVDGAATLAEQAWSATPRSDQSGGGIPPVRSRRSWHHHRCRGMAPRARRTCPDHRLGSTPSDLVAHHGDRIPGELVSATPAVLDTAASRTSIAVAVSVAVPHGIRPGTYHGHLLAEGLPEIVLPVVVEVVS